MWSYDETGTTPFLVAKSIVRVIVFNLWLHIFRPILNAPLVVNNDEASKTNTNQTDSESSPSSTIESSPSIKKDD